MKRQFAVTTLLALLLSVSTLAQTRASRPQNFNVQIPFGFTLGQLDFPAGNYTIQPLLNSVPGKDILEIISFRSAGRTYQTVIADVKRSASKDQGLQLVFAHTGERFLLTEISDGKKLLALPMPAQDPSTAQITAASRVVLNVSGDNGNVLARSIDPGVK